tara:strand:+ start:68 stop:448 length:381 start_codon:yes stop_codon:yes gene_type:complete
MTAQKIPAKATVVNFGVSFLHLKETEKIENPTEDVSPKIRPSNDPLLSFPIAITNIPTQAIIIDNQTFIEILSFKNKNPNKAVRKGIAARHNKVIAALVFVIDHIKHIIAHPRPLPPIIPDKPILK